MSRELTDLTHQAVSEHISHASLEDRAALEYVCDCSLWTSI